MSYEEKVRIMIEYFAVYGYGNFDLSIKETAKLLEILDGPNPVENVQEYYEKLEEHRMG